MNSYPDYIGFFEDVAARLTLLGQDPGKINLFFVDSPEMAATLLTAIRTKLSLPCLLVEYYDEDFSDTSGRFSELTGAFVVLQKVDKKQDGHDVVRKAIYEDAKPAADQILAHMLKVTSKMELKVGGEFVTMEQTSQGNWVGPLHNDLYGWRYQFKWRIAAAACFKPAHWKP